MTTLPLSTDLEPPDDASDLWDRPPGKVCICPACHLKAEPWSGQFCWKCSQNGDAAKTLGIATEAERDKWSGLKADIRAGLVPTEPAMLEGD